MRNRWIKSLLCVAILVGPSVAKAAEADVYGNTGTSAAPKFVPNSPTAPIYTTPASGAGTQAVNITQVGGNTVTTTIPTNDPGVIAAIAAAAVTTPFTGTPIETSFNCTGSDSIALPASTANLFLDVIVPDEAADKVWFNFAGATSVTSTPSISVKPGGFWGWIANYVTTAALHCITNNAGTITITLMYK